MSVQQKRITEKECMKKHKKQTVENGMKNMISKSDMIAF